MPSPHGACRPVRRRLPAVLLAGGGVDRPELAPFHLLATEGRVHTDTGHVWHMDTLAKVCREDPDLLLATPCKVVDVTDPAGVEEGAGWWAELTGRGGEGMVVKPLDFVLRVRRGLAPPAVKCRGREYLRPGLHRRREYLPAAPAGPGAQALPCPR